MCYGFLLYNLHNQVESAKQVVTITDSIFQASTAQAASINQVTQGVGQISSVVQTNSATAEESAAASEELSGQAQMLKNLVGKFQLKGSAALVGDMVEPGGKPDVSSYKPFPMEMAETKC